MGKETYLIEEYWHDEVTAYCTAFGILGEREEPKEGFDQSTDFNNLESSLPTDTIQVATFLNKEYSTKKYIFMFAYLLKKIRKCIKKNIHIHSSL